MLLTVDVGNTNITVGFFNGTRLTRDWRISTDPYKTGDEYEVIFHSFLTRFGLDPRSVDRVILSSVVPRLNRALSETLETLTGIPPILLDDSVYHRLPVSVGPPGVGSDLVADAVAARERYGKACIIVDFGTALTVTSVNGKGELAGVAIAPGLRTAMTSLTENTAQLPAVELKAPASVIGTDTVSAIQAGLVWGYKGLVESLVDKTKDEFDDEDIAVVATGGLAGVIAPLTDRFDEVVPHLTLEGLELCSRALEKTES